MIIKEEKTENLNEVKLTFSVPAEDFDAGMKKVYAKTAKYFNVPGFRKGKAPMARIEKLYGTEIFYEDTFNEIVPDVYEKDIAEKGLEIVSKPDINIVEIGKGKDLVFTAVVQLKPEVKVGKYKGISLKKVEYPVKEEDIQKELEQMADRNSRLVSIEDEEATVASKDIAVIDFEGFVDGVPFEGGKAEKHELEIGSNTFIPGFEDQVIGMKAGEERDISVKFPDKYFSEELAGKDATFRVKLHEIKRKELPKLDDEFAKDVSEFDTIEELKNSIKEKLENENSDKAKFETEENAIQTVCDATELEIPSGMIETELDNMMKNMESTLAYQGLNMKTYLQMIGKTEEDFRKEHEEEAKKSVKSRLVLEAIVKAENIEADDKEVEEEIKEMAANYGKSEEELMKNDFIVNYIKDNMKLKNAVKFVVDNAKIGK